MLYLAIDQHRKQLTVNLRNEQGDVLLKRQVSTEWPRVWSFLEEVQKQSLAEGGFVAILEVCGFNDWLLKLLVEYGCRETILIQPEKRSKKKTDRRDANALGELLWVNRHRLLADKVVHGIRRVQMPCEQDAADPTQDGDRVGDDPGGRGLRQLGVGVADRLDRAVPTAW